MAIISCAPSFHNFAAFTAAKGPCSDRGQAKEGEKYVACDISHCEVIWLHRQIWISKICELMWSRRSWNE